MLTRSSIVLLDRLRREPAEELHEGGAARRDVRIVLDVALGEVLGRAVDVVRLQHLAPEVEHELLVRGERRIGARQQLLRPRVSLDGQLRDHRCIEEQGDGEKYAAFAWRWTGKINGVK